jgi:hypothetical protein
MPLGTVARRTPHLAPSVPNSSAAASKDPQHWNYGGGREGGVTETLQAPGWLWVPRREAPARSLERSCDPTISRL